MMESLDIISNHRELNGIVWNLLESFGIIWNHLESSDITLTILEFPSLAFKGKEVAS